MNKRVYRIATACVLLVLLVTIMQPAVPVSAGGNVGPRAMLRAYYDTINQRNYSTAFAQWFKPSQSYDSFVAGYATTTRVDAYFGGFQPGAPNGVSGGMPTVLIGYHSDGGVVAFNGCYYVTYNDVGTGTAQWLITGASIFPLSFVPSAVNIAQYLTAYCYPRTSPYYYDTVQQLLVDYYDAVNRGEYATAYDLWTYPQQSYDNFVAGYADTTEVALFYGNFQFSGYYSTLDTGRIPVVLFGYHTDGSLAAYQGCIIMGYDQLRPGAWSIAGANLGQMAFTTTPSYTAIQQALGASCYPMWG